jgi:hypothetical protein
MKLAGKRFGRWTVLRLARIRNGRSRWRCECKCGTRRIITGGNLKYGVSRSCGCLKSEIHSRRLLANPIGTTHGMCYSPEYIAWDGMIQRCTNPKNRAWLYYGARGIRVCKRWLRSFAAFYEDMGRRPRCRSLDRRNNDGNYSPRNCRWATKATQMRNKRQRRSRRRVALTCPAGAGSIQSGQWHGFLTNGVLSDQRRQ